MTSADAILDVVGAVFGSVIGNIPGAGVVAEPIFAFLWGKLKTASPQEDITKKLESLIAQVKNYIDAKLDYAKQQICDDAISFFNSRADDLKVALATLPVSASEVISLHQSCVNQARDALDVLDDKEYGHLTIHNYAAMASLYLALLEDGIYDRDNWGISQTLKNIYLEKRTTFFESRQFSNLLAYTMDKAGQGNILLRRLFIKTTQVTNFWYCFNPEVYPFGVPEIMEPPGRDVPTNKTSHVYFQPSNQSTKCVVTNMPGGYVRQVLAKKEDYRGWLPYYPGYTGSIVRLVAPDDKYPRNVQVRYYRIADAVATKFIGLDHAVRLSFSNGSTGSVEAQIPGEGTWAGRLIFDSEAVVLDSEHPTGNMFTRGVGNGARLEYVELGNLSLVAPCDVNIEWQPTAGQQRSQVLLSAMELMLQD